MGRQSSRLGACAWIIVAACGKIAIHAPDAEVDSTDAGPACTWFRDGDQDGYGDPAQTLERCDPPAGYVSNDLD